MRRLALVGRQGAAFAIALAALALVPGATRAGEPPAPVVRTLANGLTVAVFPDTRLPLVQIQLLVPAGSAHEAPGESGIASLTAQMLGQGTTSRSAQAFADAVEALGGTLGGNAFREFTTVNGTFLASDFEAGLELLGDAVLHPIFAEERMLLVKSQMAGSLARAAQNPQTFADERLWSEVFAGHPFGRSPLGARQVLQALTVNQIRAFHRDFFRPDRALLAIAGDVPPERAFQTAESHFGAWGGKSRNVAVAAPPPVPAEGGWRIRLVDAPALTRAELRIGTAGPPRTAPDWHALELAAELLSAALPATRARLHPLREGGLFSLALTVPVDSVGEVARGVRAALERGAASAPEGSALAAVKRRLVAGQALAFETRGGWIAHWMSAAFHGLPAGAPGKSAARLEAVDGAAAREAARRWLAPGGMVLVAVGPAERLRAQLEPFGTVEIIPPEGSVEARGLSPSTDTSPPTAAQLARGRELAGRMIAAHGGLAPLRRIEDSTMEGALVIHADGREFPGEFLQVRKEPMKFLFRTRIAVILAIQGLDGNRAWSQTGERPAHIEDQDSVGVAALQSAFRSDLHHLLLMVADSTARAAWRGREQLETGEADALEIVTTDGVRRVLFLDPAKHWLVGMEQGEAGHSARRLYSDHREVSGIQWPFREERLLDGRPAMTLAIERVALNTGVRDERFRKPGSKPPPPRPR